MFAEEGRRAWEAELSQANPLRTRRGCRRRRQLSVQPLLRPFRRFRGSMSSGSPSGLGELRRLWGSVSWKQPHQPCTGQQPHRSMEMGSLCFQLFFWRMQTGEQSQCRVLSLCLPPRGEAQTGTSLPASSIFPFKSLLIMYPECIFKHTNLTIPLMA